MRRILPIVLVVIIVIAAAAVSYSLLRNSTYNSQPGNSSSGSSNMNGMNNGNQNSSSSAPEATSSVTIKNFAFSPANITVKKGTTVTWTNQDTAAHTVTETDNQEGPQSNPLDKGEAYTFTFNTVGTYQYSCSIHPNMTGSVTVTD